MMYGLPGFANLADTTSQGGGAWGVCLDVKNRLAQFLTRNRMVPLSRLNSKFFQKLHSPTHRHSDT